MSESVSSSTSMDSLLDVHSFSPSHNNHLNLNKDLAPTTPTKSDNEENDAKVFSSLNNFIQIPVSWYGHSQSQIIHTKPPSTSSDNNMSGEELAWDKNGVFGVQSSKKYPWDEDVYDDFFIKQFWTMKGMSENGESTSISTDKKDSNRVSGQNNNANSNQNYSILCSICSCFLYTLTECFL